MQETAEAAVLFARAAVPQGVGNLPFGFQPPPDDGYNRAPIPTRLKLFTADPVTLASATMGARAMCNKAGINEGDYTITPLGNPGLARLYAIGFVGDNVATNVLRTKKARDSLRNPDGSWLELIMPTATGDTKAYINVDNFAKVERVEKLSKIWLKIRQLEFSDKKLGPGYRHK